jgi:drug/metabolite transporter (DMT)-like permease
MALIGTCSSPVFSIILAAIFLKEKITALRVAGMAMCLVGVALLLVRGSWERLMNFQFTSGDIWVLGAAIFFAGYNIMVRKKPAGISAYTFLFITFCLGTIQLLPFYVWESLNTEPIAWTDNLFLVVLYLGLGTSVIAFLLWNFSIAKLGAGRTALFGNLIPLFSSIEAVFILNEELTMIHLIAGLIIIAGVIIANMRR